MHGGIDRGKEGQQLELQLGPCAHRVELPDDERFRDVGEARDDVGDPDRLGLLVAHLHIMRAGVRDVLVLCYHAVSERWPADFAVTPNQLEQQLRHLLDRGCRGATFTEAVKGPRSGRTLAVTFDDAFRSVLTLGFPVLERLGLPGTIFAPTAFMEGGRSLAWPEIGEWADGPYADELVPLSWQQLHEIADAGWEVGSHSLTHPRLTTLDDVELTRELGASKRECERQLGRPCTAIAYPFGDVDRRVVDAAAREGYEAGAAMTVRSSRVQPLAWPRFGVSREDSLARFRRQASPLVRRLRASPVGPAADRAYAALRLSRFGGSHRDR
jgi:peptidoglycan/xylan/chitin deacetylase (PgdA/CDA1 family)